MQPIEKMNLNSAPLDEIMKLAGLTQGEAHCLVAWRDRHGGFRGWAEVECVASVDPGVLKRLRQQFTVDGREAADPTNWSRVGMDGITR